MAKAKTAFVCNSCGGEHRKWQGQCDFCQAWNTLSEIRLSASKNDGSTRSQSYSGAISEVTNLSQVAVSETARVSSGFNELDRVLGGGLVAGSALLLGGQPGAGKSTLLLQVINKLASHYKVLYVTGEESLQQVALRAKRLNVGNHDFSLLAEVDILKVLSAAETQQPQILVIDSIQVMYHPDISSAAGGVAQVRECAALMTRYAKMQQVILIMVGHVTKDGLLAGPKVLEHMIDCSLMLESGVDSRYRTLRSSKNRFGAVNELGVFAMSGGGLREISNPSAIFLARGDIDSAGSVVVVVWEGSRPLLIELQALVDDSVLPNPRRLALGLDQNRLAMLLAILHRHGGVHIGSQDVFINAVGGVKITETAADLAILLAIHSSFRNRPLSRELVIFGEVGLSGEVRPVLNGQDRLKEAAKHGYHFAIVGKANQPKRDIEGMRVIAVSNVSEALQAAFALPSDVIATDLAT